MSFASRKFRDVFSELNAGLPPAAVNAGSVVGSPLNMAGRRKIVFHLDQGTGGAASSRLVLYAASASTGVGSTSIGATPALPVSATSASGGTAVLEVRGEYLADRNVGPWVIPVLSVSGGSAVAAVHANGFLESYQPASYNDAPTAYVASETLLL